LMIARTLREKGELIEAYFEFGKVVLEADAAAARDMKYESASQASRTERAKLRARLAMVTIFVKDPPDDLQIAIGERTIDKSSWGRPVPILPGVVVARATSNERPEQRQELAAMAGGDLAVTFDFSAAQAALTARGPVAAAKGSAETIDSSPFPPGNR